MVNHRMMFESDAQKLEDEVTRLRNANAGLEAERDRYRKALEFVSRAWDGNRSALDNAAWMYDCHCVAAEALRGE